MPRPDESSRRWEPATFLERVGAALVAPRAALRTADRPGAEGRTAGDATTLVALSFLATHLREIVAAVWIGTLEGPGVGLSLVLGVASRVLAMKLVVLFIAALVLTLAAGRARSLGRDFDLACVAFVPYLAVELVGSLALQIGIALGVDLFGSLTTITGILAYGWAGAILLLAWFQTRSRRPGESVTGSVISPEVTP